MEVQELGRVKMEGLGILNTFQAQLCSFHSPQLTLSPFCSGSASLSVFVTLLGWKPLICFRDKNGVEEQTLFADAVRPLSFLFQCSPET